MVFDSKIAHFASKMCLIIKKKVIKSAYKHIICRHLLERIFFAKAPSGTRETLSMGFPLIVKMQKKNEKFRIIMNMFIGDTH